MEKINPIAHINENDHDKVQPLCGKNGHLENVARLAKQFADTFGCGDFGECAGLLHDIGKFRDDFQVYIRLASGNETESDATSPSNQKVDHSAAGAIWAVEKQREENKAPIGLLLAYPIAGHHTGLPNFHKDASKGSALADRLKNGEYLTSSYANGGKEYLSKIHQPSLTRPPVANPRDMHLWIRMLFSCLVDADFLDTEHFMSPRNGELRKVSTTLAELRHRYDKFMDGIEKNSTHSTINGIRSEILTECRKGATREPGLFTLTVPTGGGKTLASMGFALDHAIKWNKSRIIVAIPYTSIIEQTAQVYRSVFKNGDDSLSNIVLEHHSNLNPENETLASQLASENWDAPIVVTTNVQLLESLFSAKSSRCRKLHNIANSVIILDETQMLPPEYLKPILSVLNSLAKDFGCSILLCSATQPSLQGHIGDVPQPGNCGGFDGFPQQSVRELMKNPDDLFNRMNRVEIQYPTKECLSWDVLAGRLSKYEQVLCIVNTRKDCLELCKKMPTGTIHLSASMCGQHRSEVIAQIKEKLKNGEPVRVISTQLIEAGVDIDFPVVFRAMAGMDSIAQAAGRCNREGKQNLGIVQIFNPLKDAPAGCLRFGAQASRNILANFEGESIALEPDLFKKYFSMYYNSIHSFDQKHILENLDATQNAFKLQFRTVSNDFSLIDDISQKSVIVWYADGKTDSRTLIRQLECVGLKRDIMRRLQRYSVNISKKYWNELQTLGYITEIKGPNNIGLDIWQQGTSSLYTENFGFSLEGPQFQGMEFIC